MSLASAPAVTETARIAEQLQRFYEGPSWLGPPLKTLLNDVDEATARRRVLPGAHTIWELVLHITGWLAISRERLSAQQIRDALPEEDWPPIAGSWQEALASLHSEVQALQKTILAFPDDRLQQPAPAAEPQLFYQLLHGVIQHSAYHAGQIALLKKQE